MTCRQQNNATVPEICYRMIAPGQAGIQAQARIFRMFGPNMMNENEIDLALLIIDTLNLDFDIESAEPTTPLYGEGFGLDSIDILEVALAVSQRYGVKLKSDDKNNVEIFKSLSALSDYIQENKTK